MSDGDFNYHPGVQGNTTDGRRIAFEQEVLRDQARELPEVQVSREYEVIQVARPTDIVTHTVEVPVVQELTTIVPKIQVRETVRHVERDEPQYIEKYVDIEHQKIVDTYVEKEVIEGETVKYVPKIDVHERKVLVTKPEVKWIEKFVDIPQIREVVRYVHSDSNVEQVIRYVPKGEGHLHEQHIATHDKHSDDPVELIPGETSDDVSYTPRMVRDGEHPAMEERGKLLEGTYESGTIVGPAPAIASPRTMPLTSSTDTGMMSSRSNNTAGSAYTPRPDTYEQVIVPKVVRTVEVRKDVPVTIDMPVPFMVPKPLCVPVDVPVLKFRDHFVPVPIRRHVVPKVVFTDETYEVDCAIEKPLLVIEDYVKPVPVDVAIKLKEKDIKIIPVDPSELSQADHQAMWMRVNADLLEQYRDRKGGDPEGLVREREDSAEDGPETSTEEKVDYGPLPMHPGHPLMMTYLQNQWIQNPSTLTHNMYSPEFFRHHVAALNSVLDPQPHQINLSEEQAVKLGPLPRDQLPNTWNGTVPLQIGEGEKWTSE